MKKKLLSLALAITMLASSVPITAFGEYVPSESNKVNPELRFDYLEMEKKDMNTLEWSVYPSSNFDPFYSYSNLGLSPHYRTSRTEEGVHYSSAARGENGKYGARDIYGNLFIDFMYDDGLTFEYGYAAASKDGKQDEYDFIDSKYGVIDFNNKTIIDFTYDDLRSDFLNNNINQNRFFAKQNGKYGLIDINNNVIIDFMYDELDGSYYEKGIYRARLDDKYGFIDVNNKAVTEFREFEFSKVDWLEYSNGYILKSTEDGSKCLDANWNVVFNGYIEGFVNGYTVFRKDIGAGIYKEGLVDSEFREVLPCIYDDLGDYSDGLIMAKIDGKIGYLDLNNNWVISPQFYLTNRYFVSMEDFNKGLAVVSTDSKGENLIIINKKGEQIVPVTFKGLKLGNGSISQHDSFEFWQGNQGILVHVDGVGFGIMKVPTASTTPPTTNPTNPTTPSAESPSVSTPQQNTQSGQRQIALGGSRIAISSTATATTNTATPTSPNTQTPPNSQTAPITPSVPNAQTPPPLNATGHPTSSTVTINGEVIAFDAYNINDNNYFKLRDLAYILSGTEKQFDVGWNESQNAISLTNNKAYTVVGGEMTSKGAGSKSAVLTNSRIFLDGKEVQFTAYRIDDNNYFKLRDIGETFDFEVDWDGTNNNVLINTNKGYTQVFTIN